jgi:hypothetical protein
VPSRAVNPADAAIASTDGRRSMTSEAPSNDTHTCMIP